ncbi:hypothetical protein [Persicobacter sp. CCB-QB2]|uniref:hypothetical protein n=1 Tax=Persicobacter sp. CCB-QB2 TaxID=1561025 RepID=UPI0006A9F262|nr:hypothetical protein [Persicobacter sp. CCB-QB2]
MKLIVKCTTCRAENDSPITGATRIKIVQKHGETFDLTCNSCGKTHTYGVDDIKAEDYTITELIKNRAIIFGVVFLTSFGLGFLFTGITGAAMVSIISTILSLALIKKNHSGKNLTFNRHKVKNRMTNIGS